MSEENEIKKSAAEKQGKKGKRSKIFPGERREIPDEGRRSGGEQRIAQDKDAFEGKEQRRASERRSQQERRNVTFDVVCKPSATLTIIEDWLGENCKDKWKLVVLDSGAEMSQKRIKVLFTLFSDKTKFISKHGGEE